MQGSSNAVSRKRERNQVPVGVHHAELRLRRVSLSTFFFSERTNSLSSTPSHVFVSSPGYQDIVKLVSQEWGSRSANADSE